jgi:hypothetical protein
MSSSLRDTRRPDHEQHTKVEGQPLPELIPPPDAVSKRAEIAVVRTEIAGIRTGLLLWRDRLAHVPAKWDPVRR